MSVDSPPAGRSRVLLAGGAAAVLLAAGGGYLLLTGGGDDSGPVAAAPVHHARPKATPTPAPAPTGSPAPPVFVPTSVRQPFRPLFTASSAPAAGAGTPVGTTAGGGVPAAPAPVRTTPAPVTPAPAQPATPLPAPVTPAPLATPGTAPTGTPARYPLKLVKIKSSGSSSLLTWTVGGRTVTTLNSQRFGRDGELVALSITRSSAGVLSVWVQAYAGTPFTMQVGQTRSVL